MSRLVSGLRARPAAGRQLQPDGACRPFGPGLFTQAFARSIAAGAAWQLPGAPFLLAAGMLMAAWHWRGG